MPNEYFFSTEGCSNSHEGSPDKCAVGLATIRQHGWVSLDHAAGTPNGTVVAKLAPADQAALSQADDPELWINFAALPGGSVTAQLVSDSGVALRTSLPSTGDHVRDKIRWQLAATRDVAPATIRFVLAGDVSLFSFAIGQLPATARKTDDIDHHTTVSSSEGRVDWEAAGSAKTDDTERGRTDAGLAWKMCPGDTALPEASRTGFSTSGCVNAVVPGTVLTTMLENGTFADVHDPYWEMDLAKLPDINATGKEYYTRVFRTELAPPDNGVDSGRFWLHLRGVSYFATVYVNGKAASPVQAPDKERLAGMYHRWSFDLGRVSAPVAVAVLIEPPEFCKIVILSRFACCPSR